MFLNKKKYYRQNLRHHISDLFDNKNNLSNKKKERQKIALYVVHTHVHTLIARLTLIKPDIHTDCY